MIETNILVNAYPIQSGALDSNTVAVLVAVIGIAGWFLQEGYKRHVKQRNLTCALLAEVKAIDHVIDEHLNHWLLKKIIPPLAASNYQNALPPLVPFSIDVYDQLADKIGLLDRELAAVIIDYYRMLHFINRFQQSADQHTTLGLKKEFCETYTRMLEKQLKKVRKMDAWGANVFARFFEKYSIKIVSETPFTPPRTAGGPTP